MAPRSARQNIIDLGCPTIADMDTEPSIGRTLLRRAMLKPLPMSFYLEVLAHAVS